MGFGIGFSQCGCVDFSLGFEKGSGVDSFSYGLMGLLRQALFTCVSFVC